MCYWFYLWLLLRYCYWCALENGLFKKLINKNLKWMWIEMERHIAKMEICIWWTHEHRQAMGKFVCFLHRDSCKELVGDGEMVEELVGVSDSIPEIAEACEYHVHRHQPYLNECDSCRISILYWPFKLEHENYESQSHHLIVSSSAFSCMCVYTNEECIGWRSGISQIHFEWKSIRVVSFVVLLLLVKHMVFLSFQF